MSKPRLPNPPPRGDYSFDKITASWLLDLWLCVQYAMDNPTGDGHTILKTASNTLEAIQSSGAIGESTYIDNTIPPLFVTISGGSPADGFSASVDPLKNPDVTDSSIDDVYFPFLTGDSTLVGHPSLVYRKPAMITVLEDI